MSYYLYLLRVYIEALELHSQSSRLFNSPTLQSLHLIISTLLYIIAAYTYSVTIPQEKIRAIVARMAVINTLVINCEGGNNFYS